MIKCFKTTNKTLRKSCSCNFVPKFVATQIDAIFKRIKVSLKFIKVSKINFTKALYYTTFAVSHFFAYQVLRDRFCKHSLFRKILKVARKLIFLKSLSLPLHCSESLEAPLYLKAGKIEKSWIALRIDQTMLMLF